MREPLVAPSLSASTLAGRTDAIVESSLNDSPTLQPLHSIANATPREMVARSFWESTDAVLPGGGLEMAP